MCEIDYWDDYIHGKIPSYLTPRRYIPDVEEEEEERIIELPNGMIYELSTSAIYDTDGKKVEEDYPLFR